MVNWTINCVSCKCACMLLLCMLGNDFFVVCLSSKSTNSKTCLKQSLKNRQNKGFKDKWQLNEGRKYCRMQFLKKPIFDLLFEWPLKTHFTVYFQEQKMLVLIWVQTFGKGYQQTPLAGKQYKHHKSHFLMSSPKPSSPIYDNVTKQSTLNSKDHT